MDYFLKFSVSYGESVSAENLSKIARYSDQDFVVKSHTHFTIHQLYQTSMSIEARELIMPGQ